MRKSSTIALLCCTLALTMGLVACSGSSTGASSGSSSGGSAEPSEIQLTDIPDTYLDIDGGITLDAVRGLTGPELAALLKQQGYEWSSLSWENKTTGNTVYIRSADDELVNEAGFSAATGKGELFAGYIKIRTSAREIIYTPDDLIAVRDAMLTGFTVEDSWLVGGGAYLYSVVADDAGERAILIVIAYDEHQAEVEFETDAYLIANGDDGIDGVIELWKS